jgi:acyl-CoA synthetase (NDP forming)
MVLKSAHAADEIKTEVKEEANVEFQRCGPQNPRFRQGGQAHKLTAPEGKLVCDAYGIPVPKEGVAKSAADAARIATDMGFPVVMKIVSPDILHKTEAGGVMVG